MCPFPNRSRQDETPKGVPIVTTKQKEKNYDYINRLKWQRVLRQTGHSLSLATTAEEDARLWQRYASTMKKLEKLERSKAASHPEDRQPKKRKRRFWRPVYNAEYVALTRELIKLDRRRRACSKQERRAIAEQIDAIKAERWTVTDFYDRETGEYLPRHTMQKEQGLP